MAAPQGYNFIHTQAQQDSIRTPYPSFFVSVPAHDTVIQEVKKQTIPILTYSDSIDDAGNYKFNYLSADGTVRNENGHQHGGGAVKKGTVSWISPEGQQFSLTYHADKNGYTASGEHLPTPPPIPQAILESVALINSKAQQQPITSYVTSYQPIAVHQPTSFVKTRQLY